MTRYLLCFVIVFFIRIRTVKSGATTDCGTYNFDTPTCSDPTYDQCLTCGHNCDYAPGGSFRAFQFAYKCKCQQRKSRVSPQGGCDDNGDGNIDWLFADCTGGWKCYACEPCPYHTEHMCDSINWGEYNSDKSNLCTNCPAGKSNENPGSHDCRSCSTGKYNSATRSACVNCGVDTYADGAGHTTCHTCGEFETTNCNTGQSSCSVTCGGGKYMHTCSSGSGKDCSNCPTGKYGQATPVASASDCSLCPAGKYGSTAGASSLNAGCSTCAAGKYQATEGRTSCTDCPTGKYRDSPGGRQLSDCEDCPAGKFQDSTGATSISQCSDCPADTYSVGSSCEPCGRKVHGQYNWKGRAIAGNPCVFCFGNLATADPMVEGDPGVWVPNLGACVPCDPGSKVVIFQETIGGIEETSADSCESCSAGKYDAIEDSLSEPLECKSCPAGFSAITHYDANRCHQSVASGACAASECCMNRETNIDGGVIFTTDPDSGILYTVECDDVHDCKPGQFQTVNDDANLVPYFKACGMCPLGKYSQNGWTSCESCQQGTFTSAAHNTVEWQQGSNFGNAPNYEFWKYERTFKTTTYPNSVDVSHSCNICHNINSFTFYKRTGNGEPQGAYDGTFTVQNTRTGQGGVMQDPLFFLAVNDAHDRFFSLGVTQTWVADNYDDVAEYDDLEMAFKSEINDQTRDTRFSGSSTHSYLLPDSTTNNQAFNDRTFQGCIACSYFYNCAWDGTEVQCNQEQIKTAGGQISQYYRARGEISTYYVEYDTTLSNVCKLCPANKELDVTKLNNYYTSAIEEPCSDCPAGMSRAADSTHDCVCTSATKFRGHPDYPQGYQDPTLCYDSAPTNTLCGASVGDDFVGGYYHENVPDTENKYFCTKCPKVEQTVDGSSSPDTVHQVSTFEEILDVKDVTMTCSHQTAGCDCDQSSKRVTIPNNYGGGLICKWTFVGDNLKVSIPALDMEEWGESYLFIRECQDSGTDDSCPDPSTLTIVNFAARGGRNPDGHIISKATGRFASEFTEDEILELPLTVEISSRRAQISFVTYNVETPNPHLGARVNVGAPSLPLGVCTTCPLGKVAVQTTRLAAQRSGDWEYDWIICEDCPQGTFQPNNVNHLYADAGQNWEAQCTDCPAGTYVDVSSRIRYAVQTCNTVYYNDCPCIPCPVDQYHTPTATRRLSCDSCVSMPSKDHGHYKKLLEQSFSRTGLNAGMYTIIGFDSNLAASIQQNVGAMGDVCSRDNKCRMHERYTFHYEQTISEGDNFNLGEISLAAGEYKVGTSDENACQQCGSPPLMHGLLVRGHCETVGSFACHSASYGQCTYCEHGNKIQELGSIFMCSECGPGFFLQTSSSQDLPTASSCNPAPKGTYQPNEAAASYQVCDRGTYQDEEAKTVCKECPVGTYQDEQESSSCFLCGYSKTGHQRENYGVFQSETGKSSCEQCPENHEACSLMRPIPWSTVGGEIILQIGKPGGFFSDGVCFLSQTGDCFACDEDAGEVFQPDRGCNSCSENEFSFNGQCQACAAGKRRFGQSNVCIDCLPCPDGYYMASTTSCVEIENCRLCPECEDPSMVRVGCKNNAGILNEIGDCRPRELVRATAVCPFSEHIETFKNFFFQDSVASETLEMSSFKTNYGLGGFSFREVFGVSYESAQFQCRRICDGSQQKISVQQTDPVTFKVEHGITNGGQCAGPFACDVQACTMLSSIEPFETSYRTPRGCPVEDPVYVNAYDVQQFDEVRSVECQPCAECGDRGSLRVTDYGRGCAKECTRLICEDNEIFDFTRPKLPLRDACTTCADLVDPQLCKETDLHLLNFETRDVTGNNMKIYFENCIPKLGVQRQTTNSGIGFISPSYGDCRECPKDTEACQENEYYASCHQNPNSLAFIITPDCRPCAGLEGLLSTQSKFVTSSGALQILYCQVKPCVDAGLTGISETDGACFTECKLNMECDPSKRVKPCVFPHDSMCVSRVPFHNDARSVVGVTGTHMNLLEHQSRQTFAGFENVLLDTFSNSRMCVWNARISDNNMNPGGTVTSLVESECDDWLEDKIVKKYPLLPLQNVVLLMHDGVDVGTYRRFQIDTNAVAFTHTDVTPHLGMIGLEIEMRYQYQTRLFSHIPKADVDWHSVSQWLPQVSLLFWAKASDEYVDVHAKFMASDVFRSPLEDIYDSMSNMQFIDKTSGVSVNLLHHTLANCDRVFMPSVLEHDVHIPTSDQVYGKSCLPQTTHCRYADLVANDNFISRLAKMTNFDVIPMTPMQQVPFPSGGSQMTYVGLRQSFDTECVAYVNSRAAIYCIDSQTGNNNLIWPTDTFHGHIQFFNKMQDNFFVVTRQHDAYSYFFVSFPMTEVFHMELIMPHGSISGQPFTTIATIYDTITNEEDCNENCVALSECIVSVYFWNSRHFCNAYSAAIIVPVSGQGLRFHRKVGKESRLLQTINVNNQIDEQVLTTVSHGNDAIFLQRNVESMYSLNTYSVDDAQSLHRTKRVHITFQLGDMLDSVTWVMETNQYQLVLLVPMRSGLLTIERFYLHSFEKIRTTQLPFSNDITVLSTQLSLPSTILFPDNSMLISVDGSLWQIKDDDSGISEMPKLNGLYNHVFVLYFQAVLSIPLSISRHNDPGNIESVCGRFYEQHVRSDIEICKTIYTTRNMCMHLCYEKVFCSDCIGYEFHNGVCNLYKSSTTHTARRICHEILHHKEMVRIVDSLFPDNTYNVIMQHPAKMYVFPDEALKVYTQGETTEGNIFAFEPSVLSSLSACTTHCAFVSSEEVLSCRNYDLSRDNDLFKLNLPLSPQDSFLEVASYMPADGSVMSSYFVQFEITDTYFVMTIQYVCDNTGAVFLNPYIKICEVSGEAKSSLWIGRAKTSYVFTYTSNDVVTETFLSPSSNFAIKLWPGVQILRYDVLTYTEFLSRTSARALLTQSSSLPTSTLTTDWKLYRHNVRASMIHAANGLQFYFYNRGNIRSRRQAYFDSLGLSVVLSRKSFSSHPEHCTGGHFARDTDPCTACPAGTFSLDGAYECLECEAGQYQAYAGRTSCELCGKGKTTLTSRSQGHDACVACAVGKYADTEGSSVCATCPDGYEGVVDGDKASLHTACSECAAGKYSTNGDPCQHCDLGKYAGRSQGRCEQCMVGYYAVQERGTDNSICKYCPVGKYSDVEGVFECQPCPANTYQPHLGQSSVKACLPCSTITRSFSKASNSNQSQCECGMGSYGRFGECNPCPLHSHSNSNAADVSACYCSGGFVMRNTTCTACPVGKFSNFTKECLNCPAGFYNNVPGAQFCKMCPAPYTSRPGQTYCIPTLCDGCPIGKYLDDVHGENEQQCIECQAGTYSMGSCDSCIHCPLGTFSNSSSSACEQCPYNSYSNSTQSIQCHACPPHYFTSDTGSTSQATCQSCASGYQRLDGMSECEACAEGSESHPGGACTLCPGGQCICASGEIRTDSGCAKCAAGKYSDGAQCQNCPPGHYNAEEGQIICTQCASGSTSEEGATICETCESGSYSQDNECIQCPVNTYEVSNQCVDCPTGLFSSIGSTKQTDCTYDPTMSFISVMAYVPTYSELQQIHVHDDTNGISPLRGSNAANWERLHVGVGLEIEEEVMLGCAYRIHIAAVSAESEIVLGGRLAELGCTVIMTDLYSSCYMEIPTALATAQNNREVAVQALSKDTVCQWPQKFEVTLEPEVSLYECALDHFWSENAQNCEPCSVELQNKLGLDDACALGTHIVGCDALAGHDPICQPCTLPAGLVWTDAIYFWVPTAICEYECVDGYFQDEDGLCKPCSNYLHCSIQESGFAAGHRRQSCTKTQNEMCVPCDPIEGFFASNSEFKYSLTECETQCKTGLFYEQDGACLPCKTLAIVTAQALEQALLNPGSFYHFTQCTPQHDSDINICPPLTEGGRIIGHAVEFGQFCMIECDVGFYSNNVSCLPCPHLEEGRYYIDDQCSVGCNQSLGFYDASKPNLCVDCSEHCTVGFYHTIENDNCVCKSCRTVVRGIDWAFVTSGRTLDDAYSCELECNTGFFLDFYICRPFSTVSCAPSQYFVPGTATTDNTCRQCSHCIGRRKISECSQSQDTVCEECPELLNGAMYFGENCESACTSEDVLNKATGVCEKCQTVCGLNSYHPPPEERQNCTHCVACDPKPPQNALLFENTCRWACPLGYLLEQDKCVEMAFSEFQRNRRSGGYGCPVLSCGYGLIPVPRINACSQCMPCYGTDVARPPAHEENTTWVWTGGFECRVECKRGYLRFREGSVLLCLTADNYEARINNLMRKDSFVDASWTKKADNNTISWLLCGVIFIACSIVTIVIAIM